MPATAIMPDAIRLAAFEAELRADGFVEIETKTYQPAPANGQHGHHFDIRGLVVDGVFTVRHSTGPARDIDYRPGDVFFVANGDLHHEEIGPAGARVLLGRRY
jgi:quercetin dioxygenase-like cupin family protein